MRSEKEMLDLIINTSKNPRRIFGGITCQSNCAGGYFSGL